MTAKVEQQPIKQEVQEDQDAEYDGIKVIQEFMLSPDIGESPININLAKTIPISLPPLEWHHHDLPPKKMKCTNTGHTLIMSAKWHQERPYISGGPLSGNYVFSQLHFHWGKDNMEGSEHTVDGASQLLEMHVVLFKSCYLTQEAALKKRDGILVLVYFFKLQGADNSMMDVITDAIPYIQLPHSSARLDPLPLSYFMIPFQKDYFMYWGTVTTTDCVHILLWLISREPIGISINQIDMFRTLLNVEEEPLQGNFRPIQDVDGVKRTVFHANPSMSLYSTLLPLRRRGEVVKKSEMSAKSESHTKPQRDDMTTEIFRVEPQHENPLKDLGDKKETNKYTISTSLKVDPELLEKLKGAKTSVKEPKSEGGGKRKQERRAVEQCLETTSVTSNLHTKTESAPQKEQPTISHNLETKNKCTKKSSLIPRLITKKK